MASATAGRARPLEQGERVIARTHRSETFRPCAHQRARLACAGGRLRRRGEQRQRQPARGGGAGGGRAGAAAAPRSGRGASPTRGRRRRTSILGQQDAGRVGVDGRERPHHDPALVGLSGRIGCRLGLFGARGASSAAASSCRRDCLRLRHRLRLDRQARARPGPGHPRRRLRQGGPRSGPRRARRRRAPPARRLAGLLPAAPGSAAAARSRPRPRPPGRCSRRRPRSQQQRSRNDRAGHRASPALTSRNGHWAAPFRPALSAAECPR